MSYWTQQSMHVQYKYRSDCSTSNITDKGEKNMWQELHPTGKLVILYVLEISVWLIGISRRHWMYNLTCGVILALTNESVGKSEHWLFIHQVFQFCMGHMIKSWVCLYKTFQLNPALGLWIIWATCTSGASCSKHC